MKLTNVYNLPQPIVDAIANDPYTKGDADFSVTELLQPPRIGALMQQHWDELEEDASERIWSLLGKAVHHMIDTAAQGNPEHLTENIFYIEVDGHKIKGQADELALHSGVLSDYKVTTVWKLQKREFDDWTAQQNIYAYMLRQHGFTVNRSQIITILRDWSKPEAARTPNYPLQQVATVDIPLWDNAVVEALLKERIALHLSARSGNLPECNDAERWVKPPVWAIMRQGNVKATKIYDSEEAANEDLSHRGNNFYVQKRPGAAARCENYCSVSRFCTQWANDPRNKGKALQDLFGG